VDGAGDEETAARIELAEGGAEEIAERLKRIDTHGATMYRGSMAKVYFTNGIPELLILRLLSRQEMYGYQLVQAIRDRSAEAFHFGEGCLYPVLHRLTHEGYLTTRREVVEGRPRHYYKTSRKGVTFYEKLKAEWTSVVRGTETILEASHAY
jgi:PadR family transcriptional regulator PadR